MSRRGLRRQQANETVSEIVESALATSAQRVHFWMNAWFKAETEAGQLRAENERLTAVVAALFAGQDSIVGFPVEVDPLRPTPSAVV